MTPAMSDSRKFAADAAPAVESEAGPDLSLYEVVDSHRLGPLKDHRRGWSGSRTLVAPWSGRFGDCQPAGRQHMIGFSGPGRDTSGDLFADRKLDRWSNVYVQRMRRGLSNIVPWSARDGIIITDRNFQAGRHIQKQ